MFSLDDRPVRLCDGVSRREWLRVGGLSTLGLSLADLLRSEARARDARESPLRDATFGRAKSVIFLWLQGGPPQHETFDPKPDAPSEIRGPFRPIQTNIPGIQFSELLPRTARIADKLAVVRSIATDDNNHDVSGYWVLTGYPYGPGSARQIKPNDWPYFGSIVKMLRPSEQLPALTSVWLPDVMRLNDNVTPAGQTAGFLGKTWEPERFVGDPSAPEYQVEGLTFPAGLTRARVDRRRSLLEQVDGFRRAVDRSGTLESWDRLSQQAYDLVTSGRAREAFDLSKEPDAVRDRYGRHGWGQSTLLARRLVEAGVRLVHVNWTREPGDSAVDNPMWDTHTQNADRLQDVLCPQFDITFPALIADLDARGLLDETLVVAIGEFGRTPRINPLGGRDHWGNVFSFALAGAGISGGQVYGSSDKQGAYPASNPIRPHDLTATIFHLLGIDHRGVFLDRGNRPNLLTRGEPLDRLLGDHPATAARTEPGGDPAFVPPYDTRLLLDTDFAAEGPLIPVSAATRDKGWRAFPIAGDEGTSLPLAVRREHVAPHAPWIAIALDEVAASSTQPGRRALLAQEIRSARGGHYTFTIRASAHARSRDDFDRLFRSGRVVCRLVLFRFADSRKDPTRVQELASIPFVPELSEPEAAGSHTLSRFLGSTVPGTNFATGNGLGVAVVVETKPAAAEPPGSAVVRIHEVTLVFDPRPRDESVTV
jgi:hypothetical protein